ncbi:DUF1960-domain-containing protein [Ascobolus immersus RN42]|uniref:DUF1960-domain-containing protein n=1 Tax=Ascobolus immersus RN42 TaxID=1160509 RepID=A0A3N4I3M0_ASCIM|nr:DUF1960-domain-containing protein [Ascobolus immersus RN42]
MKGDGQQTKVIYNGQNGANFVVYVESEQEYQNWLKQEGNTIPLAQVVNGYTVLRNQHGNTGITEEPSNAELENEFGTSNVDEVIQKILKNGNIQSTKNHEREGNRNLANGSRVGHGGVTTN